MEMRFRRCFCLGGKNNVLLVATRIRCSTIKQDGKSAEQLKEILARAKERMMEDD